MQILEICPPAANKSICNSKGKHYKIADDVFVREYERHSTVSAVAAALNCSTDYVYRNAKKLKLNVKCGCGGRRSGAGRPPGKNKNNDKKTRAEKWKDIEHKMKKQLKIDQRVNSFEVNIHPGRVGVRGEDYYRLAGSVYRKNKCLIRQPGLPQRLRPTLGKI